MSHISRIYLTGFMGSGKSSVAPRVARGLKFSSMDLDDRIVEHLGMSIPAIFDVLGEQAFREAESKLLLYTAQQTGLVVSLGGGAVLNQKNLAFCLENGLLVHLKASANVLAERLEHAARARPKLQDREGKILTGNHLRARIETLTKERAKWYGQAHETVEVDGKGSGEVAQDIIEVIRNRTS